MTYFDVRIPGLKMTVVAADGQYIHPVSIDEFRIAPAETYDVLVEPTGQDAFTIFCQDMGRTGYAAGTGRRHGLQAPIPARDPRPLLTMSDMGHDMGSGGHGGHDMAAMKGHGRQLRRQHGPWRTRMPPARHRSIRQRTQQPAGGHAEFGHRTETGRPGIGLRDNGRKVLTSARCAACSKTRWPRARREIELHLTGHMEKFSWSFDGILASAEPLRLNYGERMRIVLVNDTMQHLIHLHVWSDPENAQGEFQVRKHTIDMPPGTRRAARARRRARPLGLSLPSATMER